MDVSIETNADVALMAEAICALFTEGDVCEMRVLDGKVWANAEHRTRSISGFYDDAAALVRDADTLSRWGGKFYVTLNPVAPHLLALSSNTYTKARIAAGDSDIAVRRWVMIDCDPVRAAGFEKFSASNEEKAAAGKVMRAIQLWLSERGFGEAIEADSGNGFHLLYPVQMENNDESTSLVKSFLEALDRRFSNNQVRVDTVVYNAARITKLYGTWACKGGNTPERPWRLSRLTHVPAATDDGKLMPPVPAERFQAVIDEIGIPKPTATFQRRAGQKLLDFDMEGFLAQHGIEHRDAERRPDGRTIWTLLRCPFDPSHEGRDAAVFMAASGACGFKCFHNSCTGRGWREFRTLVDPAYDPEAGRQRAVAGGNLYDALEAFYEFRKNVVSNQIEFRDLEEGGENWYVAEDRDYNSMKIRAIRVWGLQDTAVGHIMEWADSDATALYHPVRDWLSELRWDGRDHIGDLAALVQTDDDELFRAYLRAWFVRAVDQVMHNRANEYMIVLAGSQGVGKTTFTKAIVPPSLRDEYYHAARLEPGKDGQATLTQKLLIVDDELVGLRKTEVEAIKAMLSSTNQTYRPPYGRTAITRPRLASFIGATNECEFLTDPTGSRRFLTITMLWADLERLRAFDATGAWAQAAALLQSGDTGYLSNEVRSRQEAMNAQKTEQTQFDDYVAKYVRVSTDTSCWGNTSEIAHQIQVVLDAEFKQVARITINQATIRELGRALRKADCKQDTHGSRKWKVRVCDRYDLGLQELIAANTGAPLAPVAPPTPPALPAGADESAAQFAYELRWDND